MRLEGLGVEDKEQNLVILDWAGRYLGAGPLSESEYDAALLVALRLQHCGLVTSSEWVAMVRQANAALLMFAEDEAITPRLPIQKEEWPRGQAG